MAFTYVGPHIPAKRLRKVEKKYRKFQQRFYWYLFLTEKGGAIMTVLMTLLTLAGLGFYATVVRSMIFAWLGETPDATMVFLIGLIIFTLAGSLGCMFGIFRLHDRYCGYVLRKTVQRRPVSKKDLYWLRSIRDIFHQERLTKLGLAEQCGLKASNGECGRRLRWSG